MTEMFSSWNFSCSIFWEIPEDVKAIALVAKYGLGECFSVSLILDVNGEKFGILDLN